MPAHITLPLLAALLLNNAVVAQHIGLRRIASLREAWGLALVTGSALLGTVLMVSPLRIVFARYSIEFLTPFVAAIALASLVQLFEQWLRASRPNWFPPIGDHRLLALGNGLILLAASLPVLASGLWSALSSALLYAGGAGLLLMAFQALREHIAQPAQPALDMLCAGFVVLALCGLSGVFA